jgi:hypothetical protein
MGMKEHMDRKAAEMTARQKLAKLLEMRLASVDDGDGRLDVGIMRELQLTPEEYVALDRMLSKLIDQLKEREVLNP